MLTSKDKMFESDDVEEDKPLNDTQTKSIDFLLELISDVASGNIEIKSIENNNELAEPRHTRGKFKGFFKTKKSKVEIVYEKEDSQ